MLKQIVWIDLLLKYLLAFRKIWSPIVKKKREFYPASRLGLFLFTFQVMCDSDWPELVPVACQCDPCPPTFKLSERV